MTIAGFWAIIRRANYATNSLFLFPAVLVMGRFYTRVGDLDFTKSLFVFPAGLIGGCVVALAAAYILDPAIRTLTTHTWIASRGRGLILAAICTFASLPLMTIGITNHRLIPFLLGSLLLGIALLTMENTAPGHKQQLEEDVI
jgi:hypothetical protein